MFSLLLAAVTLPEPLVPLDVDKTTTAARGYGVSILYTRYELLIAPDGRARKCTLARSSGAPKFDDYVCTANLTIGRFKAARDDAGRPIYGVLQMRMVWLEYPGQPILPQTPADIQLSIRPITGLKLPNQVSVIVTISIEGRIANCQGVQKTTAKLLPIACSEARMLPPQLIVRDDSGQAVQYVRNITVGFAADPTAK